MDKNGTTTFRRFLIILGITAVYFAAGKLGLSLAFVNASSTAVWPPAGIALACMLLLGYRIWPAIFIGAFLTNITTAGSFATSLAIALGNTLEAFAGAYLVNRFADGHRAFRQVQNIFKFTVLAGIFATMISPFIGVTSLVLGGFAEANHFGPIWITWWLGDMTGILMVAPLIILWYRNPGVSWSRKQIGEIIFLAFVTILIGQVVFNGMVPFITRGYPLDFLTIPVLAWIAFRFGKKETAAAAFLLSSIAIWGTLRGFGPFAQFSPNESLLLLQLFLGFTTIVAIAFARAVAEYKQEQRRFRALIENTYDALSLIDAGGEIVYTSPSTTRVLGYDPDELTGTRLSSLIHPDDIEMLRRAVVGLRATPNGVMLLVARVKRKDGNWIWIESTSKNLLQEIEVAAIVVNYRDITREKEIEHAKNEFISAASYQLHHPLATIGRYLKSLQAGKGTRDPIIQQQYIKEIERAHHGMVEIADDLLRVSRIELNTIVMNARPTNLQRVANDVVSILLPKIAAKELTVVKEGDLHNQQVSVDPNIMTIILHNLIANAICYSPAHRSITLRFTELPGEAVVEIIDTGCGIPLKNQEKIFTKFFRAENARLQEPYGTGLGLYIVKSLVHLSGGRIWFESEENKGTTFSVAFPWVDSIRHPAKNKRREL